MAIIRHRSLEFADITRPGILVRARIASVNLARDTFALCLESQEVIYQ